MDKQSFKDKVKIASAAFQLFKKTTTLADWGDTISEEEEQDGVVPITWRDVWHACLRMAFSGVIRQAVTGLIDRAKLALQGKANFAFV